MPFSADLDIRVTDSSLRDGSHAKHHQFTIGGTVRRGRSRRGRRPGHRGGARRRPWRLSFNYGFSRTRAGTHRAAVETAKQAKIAFLMLPGLGSRTTSGRPPTTAPPSAVSPPTAPRPTSPSSTSVARGVGLETVGFLMMAHSRPPEVLARQARIMADAGCQCVYVVDSAGALVLEEAATGSPRSSANSATTPKSASTVMRISDSASPTPSWPPGPGPSRSTAPPGASAPAPATPPSRRSPLSPSGSASGPGSTP